MLDLLVKLFCIFSFHFLPSRSLDIYVDSSINCSSDCGSSENPFMVILDKIIENDNITETQYPYLANNSDPTNSSYIFKLSILGSHDFNFTSLNNTRPCNYSLD